MAELDGNGAHAPRIKTEGAVSNFAGLFHGRPVWAQPRSNNANRAVTFKPPLRRKGRVAQIGGKLTGPSVAAGTGLKKCPARRMIRLVLRAGIVTPPR
jgi:hypothetical protein